MDPYKLPLDEFAKLGQEALFLQEFHRKSLEKALASRLDEAMVNALSVLIK